MHLFSNRNIKNIKLPSLGLALLLIIISTSTSFGQPEPPLGKRWAIVVELSDSFEGTEVNTEKWSIDPKEHHRTNWPGRTPAIFHPDYITLKDGHLNIEVGKLSEPIVDYTYSNPVTYDYYGAGLRGYKLASQGHYFECRAKMNQTEMGGGFWLAGGGACGLSHEIDITESVGLTSSRTANWGKDWDYIMHSNTFHHKTACNDLDRLSDKINLDTKNHERFYRYGFWWKNPEELHFYVDGELVYTIKGPTDFDHPLTLQYDIEAYDWNPFDDIGGGKVVSGTKEERTTLVDYIHTFKLVDADDPNVEEFDPNVVDNGDFESGRLDYWRYWGELGSVVSEKEHVHSGEFAIELKDLGGINEGLHVKPNTEYTLSFVAKTNVGGKLNIFVRNGASVSETFTGTDYTKQTINFTTENTRKVEVGFWTLQNTIAYVDDIVVEEVNPTPIVFDFVKVFKEEEVIVDEEEGVSIDNTNLSVPLQYKVNQERDLNLRLVNAENELVYKSQINAYPGYANQLNLFELDSMPVSGDYLLKVDILPKNGELANPIASTEVNFSLTDPNSVPTPDNLTFFPNPTSGDLFISEDCNNKEYHIYALDGKKLRSGLVQNQIIDLDGLVEGIYVIGIEGQFAMVVKK
ncbi:MAG: carbohydrate binding domain-containing protein [Bacteroidota bacterium]